MKQLRIYVDTCVIGGCFDPDFERWSNRLIEAFRRRQYAAVLPSVTAGEMEGAHERVTHVHSELMEAGAEILPVSPKATDLLGKYMDRRILGPKFQNDMLHIAIATISEVDVLVTWNFRHIVRLNKIRLFRAANIEYGYKEITICSPREIVPDETNK